MTNLLTHIIYLVVILFAFFHLQSSEATAPECVKKTNHTPAKKPHVVLIHGFMSGGWCWYKVRCSLEALGYTVTSLDLKGAGIDPTDASTIDTFEQYNEPLDHFMAQLPQHEKVALVAHSAGGISITKTLHDHPDKVQFAIYVAATMIKNGYTTCEHLSMGVPHFNETKCYSSCPKKLPDPTCFEKAMSPSNQPIPIGSVEGYTLAKSLLRKGPYRAICTSKFADKGSGIDKVPRVYVKTLNDKALLPEQQDAMIKQWPPCEVHGIPNDHDAPNDKPHMLAAFVVDATLSYGSA